MGWRSLGKGRGDACLGVGGGRRLGFRVVTSDARRSPRREYEYVCRCAAVRVGCRECAKVFGANADRC